jgi:hypothetical protein
MTSDHQLVSARRARFRFSVAAPLSVWLILMSCVPPDISRADVPTAPAAPAPGSSVVAASLIQDNHEFAPLAEPAAEPWWTMPGAAWRKPKIQEGKALDRTFFRHTWPSWDGAMNGKDPLWGTPNISIARPEDYPHITSLDCDDPASFFYTLRPNMFNVPIPDEWDWLSMINTERSDFTDLTYTVGKGMSYLETGYTYQHINTPQNHTSLRSLPEALLRYGLTDELEIRLQWFGYYMLDQRDQQTGADLVNFGGSDLDVTTKYELWQQNDFLPMTVLIVGALLPTGTRGFSGGTVQPHWGMVNGWGLRRWLYLKHESGLNYLTQPTFAPTGGLPAGFVNPNSIVFAGSRYPAVYQWHESVSLIYHASKHFGGFVEWFDLFGTNQPNAAFLDTGVFIYPTPNVQFDAVFGHRIDEPSGTQQYFAKAGFATRW